MACGPHCVAFVNAATSFPGSLFLSPLIVVVPQPPALPRKKIDFFFSGERLRRRLHKTSETISDSAECYAGLQVRFELSAACL